MEDPIAGDGERIPSQAGDGEGIPSQAMGSAGSPAAANGGKKTCMESCQEWTSWTGVGRVKYKDQVYYAAQHGDDGKPKVFLPDEHRKYDAKVRGTQAAVQRDTFEPFLLPAIGLQLS